MRKFCKSQDKEVIFFERHVETKYGDPHGHVQAVPLVPVLSEAVGESFKSLALDLTIMLSLNSKKWPLSLTTLNPVTPRPSLLSVI